MAASTAATVSSHTYRATDQRVEQRRHAGPRLIARADGQRRPPAGRGGRGAHAEGEHGAAGVGRPSAPASARRPRSGPSTTTAVSASPSAASTAGSQPVVDLDEVEQRAEHALDVGEPLGAGAGVRRVERQLQRLDARRPSRRRFCGILAVVGATRRPTSSAMRRRCSAASTSATSGPSTASASVALTRGSARSRRRARRVGHGAVRRAVDRSAQIAVGALDGRADASAARRGPRRRRSRPACRTDRCRSAVVISSRSVRNDSSSASSASASGPNASSSRGDVVELLAEAGHVGLEIGHHTRVEQLAVVALERSATLDAAPRRARGPVRAAARPARDGRRRRSRPAPTAAPRSRSPRCRAAPAPTSTRSRLAQPRGDRRRASASLVRNAAISRPATNTLSAVSSATSSPCRSRGLGLSFERAQLATHLAEQVLHAQQVGLGRVEPAFGLLLALAELQDAGCFLDDRRGDPRGGRSARRRSGPG